MLSTRRQAQRSIALGLLLLGLSAVARAQDSQDACENESSCTFKKPNVILVLDYSSSMTGSEQAPAYFPPGQTVTTRWLAELDAATWILRYDRGFFANNTRIALTRFGHDPDTKHPGTTVGSDKSFPPITDGFAIDVPFDGSDGDYLQCKASGVEAAVEVLRGTPPPPVATTSFDPQSIMLTWTRGALRSAHELVKRTRERHEGELNEHSRRYEVVLMTDGDWTCPDTIGQGCNENPAPEAASLYADGVPVHVIAFGDATMTPSLNEVALQGGTSKSIDAKSPQGIIDAFSGVLDSLRDGVIVPTCTQKLPRMMVIMDASTSMLVGNASGETKWDKARFALTGNPAAPNPGDAGYVEPVLRHKLTLNGRRVAIEDLLHMGMVAFAGPNQQKLMVDYGPCMRDNFAWAMDPATSCAAPGCKDPYAGAPIAWTFKDSDSDRQPPFVRSTHSYMPDCAGTPGSKSCASGSPTTFTGQGLEFAHQTIEAYKRNPSPFSLNDQTRFVNVLITDGETSEGSSSVQAALTSMVSEGIATYVIGFGTSDELDAAQLEQYAIWGNTQHAIIVDPSKPESAAALADALSGIVSSLGLDACCVLNDCEAEPEPADPRAVCGDGKVEGDEICDDGPLNASYAHCGGDCMSLHLRCGDGRVDGPETCDDGNKRAHDGCGPDCQPDDAAADGGVDPESDSGVSSRVGGVAPGTLIPRAGMAAPAGVAGITGSLPARRPPMAADAGVTAPRARDGGCGCSAPGSGASRVPARQALSLLMLMLLLTRPARRVPRSRKARSGAKTP
jgi:cysteine-rich repeat protein